MSKEKIKNPGIYMLKSKIDPEKYYIGGTVNLSTRGNDYRTLRCLHPNVKKHINKYGIDDLEFIIIEKCLEWQLFYKEQYYISELSPPLNAFIFASNRDIGGKEAKALAMEDMKIDGLHHVNIFNYENKLCEYLKKDLDLM